MTKPKPIACNECAFFPRRCVEPQLPNAPTTTTPAIMLVGDYPSLKFPRGGVPFKDRNGMVVSMLLKRLQAFYNNLDCGPRRWYNLQKYLGYAVRCCSDDTPKKDVITACRTHLEADILRIRPKVVITLGAMPTQTLLRTRIKFKEIQGSFLPATLDVPDTKNSTHRYEIFPTYSPKAVLAKPGLFDEMLRELHRAFLQAEGQTTIKPFSEEELREAYCFPRTVEDVAALCDEIINYHNEGQDPADHFIAVDTETSSLEMHDPEALMIMISFAWATRKAASIVLDHPKGWWTPTELDQVKYHVRRVLSCAKPKVLHNYKFDQQVIVHRYGFPLTNVMWDTMGGEHLLEEAKKGAYGLKVLTRTRLPRYAGYEDKIAEFREAHGGLTRADEAKRYRKALLAYKQTQADYAMRMDVYDKEFARYMYTLNLWEDKRQAEKERAANARKSKTSKEERRMHKEAYGKKPSKPRKPIMPKEPVHQEPFDFTKIPLEDLELYAGVDADVTRQHVLHQVKRLNTERVTDIQKCKQYHATPPKPVRPLMQRHVIPTSRSLAAMEFTGFPVDLDYLEDLDSKLADVVAETEERLYTLAGEKFVIGNPAEIARIMFNSGFYQDDEHVVVPLDENIRRTTAGQIKSDAKALLYVANTYGFEFPRVVLAHRKAQKARNPFLTNVREHARIDGRMHPNFWLTGTATGRLSSSGENMQNCFGKDTEILTETGWIRFDELPQGLKVAQFNPTTNKIDFVVPLEYIQRPCQPGELLQLELQQIDLQLTRQHQQLLLRQRGTYAKVNAEDIKSGSMFMHAGMYSGGTEEMDPAWITLLCAAQVDGSWTGYQWDFGFKKKRKIRRFLKTLHALNIPVCEYASTSQKRRRRFAIKGTAARRLYAQLGESKAFGSWLLTWSRKSLDIFLDEIMHWDGSYTRKDCYSSNGQQNADWVQIIAMLSDRRARIRPYTTKVGNTNWQVDIPLKRKHSWTNHLIRYPLYDYKDDVYCVRVPTECIIVRRNGKAVITGNCPKKLAGFNIKKIFVPPEGNVLVNTDAKGAEIRIFAAYSMDEKLIAAINDGLDTHSFFTANVFGEKYKEVEQARDIIDAWYGTAEGLPKPYAKDTFAWAEKLVRKRTNCKRVVFGTLYGALAPKIAETAGISLEEAQEVIDLMFRMFPSIPTYIESTQREVQLFRWVATRTGRKRHFPLADMRAFRNRCFRQAVNFKIQSTSSDIVLWVMNQIFPIIVNDLKGQFHATVHDSIVPSIPAKYITQIPDIMYEYGTRRVAKEFPWLPVPFLWDVEVGPSYGEVAAIDKYLQGQKQHERQEIEEIISGEEIRAEINEHFAN